MTVAEDLYREGRTAVLERAQAAIDDDATNVEVGRYHQRRLLGRAIAVDDANVPATRLDAIRDVAALVAANAVLLDAANADDPQMLERGAATIEDEMAGATGEAALARFAMASTELLSRLEAEPGLIVEAIYPVARTAADLTAFVAAELHLVARMLDPNYEPSDPRLLMRTLNSSLRSMIGHGLEDWVSERVKPWRNMVIRRGLAWP